MGKKQLLMTPKAVSDRKYAAKKAHERKRRREAAAALAATLTIADGVSMPVQDPAQLTLPETTAESVKPSGMPTVEELLAAESDQAAASEAVELEIAEESEPQAPTDADCEIPESDRAAALESELAEMKKGFEYAVTVREVFRDRLALLSHEASKAFGFAIDCTQETEVGPEESGIAKILSQVRHLKTGIESKETKLAEEKKEHGFAKEKVALLDKANADLYKENEDLKSALQKRNAELELSENIKRQTEKSFFSAQSEISALKSAAASMKEAKELDDLKTNAWIAAAIVLAMALAASLFY